MLKLFKKMKNNTGGYVLVYVVLLIGFVTLLFASMAAMLNGRTTITDHNVTSQQLQVTAQSALNSIVDEFENNAPLKAKLAEYVQGSGQTADFKLTNDTGITDDVKVKITKVEGEENKARIEVEARNKNNTNSVSIAYAIIDYAEPPKGESAGVVDNLLVAFLPSNVPQQTKLFRKNFKGNVIINNFGKEKVELFNANRNVYLGSIITSGDIDIQDGFINAMEGSGPIKIGSTGGTVSISGTALLMKDSVSLIAGKKGYNQDVPDNRGWQDPKTKIITGDGGELTIDNISGEVGSLISGGKMKINQTDVRDLTIYGDVIGTKDITLSKGTGNNNLLTTIKGDVLCGEDLKFKVNNSLTVTGDIAAVGSVTDGDSSYGVSARNIYAGRKIELENLNSFSAGTLLSGANYRNGDGSTTKTPYISGGTNKGGITLKGSNISIARAVINDANGTSIINGADANNIYKRNASEGFDGQFTSANNTWRSLMLKVEKGADSQGFVNLAAALTPSEASSGVKLDAFTNTMEPANGYYKIGDTAVSHHSQYTVDTAQNVLNSTITKEFKSLEDEFAKSIPDMTKTPDVVIPEALKTKWARVTCNGSGEVVINEGGYIQVYSTNVGRDAKITAIDNNDSSVKTFSLDTGADIVFDTTNGKSYDILVGNKALEEYAGNEGNCYFPFDICVNQPKENPGFVRFFIPEKLTFWAAADDNLVCKVENIGESKAEGKIPEVYLFYNGTNTLEFKGRHTRGFIIAPHCVLNFNLASVDSVTKNAFEGLMICGNLVVHSGDEDTSYVYHLPQTHTKALTTDVYKYN